MEGMDSAIMKFDRTKADACGESHDRIAINAGQALSCTNAAAFSQSETTAICRSIGRIFIGANPMFWTGRERRLWKVGTADGMCLIRSKLPGPIWGWRSGAGVLEHLGPTDYGFLGSPDSNRDRLTCNAGVRRLDR